MRDKCLNSFASNVMKHDGHCSSSGDVTSWVPRSILTNLDYQAHLMTVGTPKTLFSAYPTPVDKLSKEVYICKYLPRSLNNKIPKAKICASGMCL